MFYFSVLLLISYFIRLWISSFYGLHPDEAYYFVWSRFPAWGYFDHPPMIAWLIHWGDWLVHYFVSPAAREQDPLFYSQLGVKLLPTFFSGVIAPLAIAQTVENIQRHSLRVSQMLIILSSPIFLIGPLLLTPDAPFFTGWALALFYAVKFLLSRPDEAWPGEATPFNRSRAIRMGIVLAFCAYSKYTAILAAFLFLVTGAGLYNSLMAGITAFVLYVPHLLWVYFEGKQAGAGIFFQLKNGLGGADATVVYRRAGDLILSQVFLWTPFVFFACFLIPLAKLRKLFVQQKNSELLGTLFLWAAVPLIFFSLSSLKRPAEANWPMVGVLAGLVILLTQISRRQFALYFVLLGQLFVLTVGIMMLTNNRVVADLLRPYAPKLSQKLEQPSRIHEFEDWDKLHEIIFAATRSRTDIPIVLFNYQTLSELLFEDTIATTSKKIGWDKFRIWSQARKSQFNLIPAFEFAPKSPTPYWLIAGSLEIPPLECRLYQTVFKSPTELKTYLVYRCGF